MLYVIIKEIIASIYHFNAIAAAVIDFVRRMPWKS
jgi:hypothetical protein